MECISNGGLPGVYCSIDAAQPVGYGNHQALGSVPLLVRHSVQCLRPA